MFSQHSNSPELQPFFADEEPNDGDLKPFEFDDEHDTNDLEGGGRIPGEEVYDAINDETFGNCEPLGAGDLEGLAERTKLLELKDEAGAGDFSWPLPESIPVPSTAENGAHRGNDTSAFADWLINANFQSSSSKLDRADYSEFLNNAKLFEPRLDFKSDFSSYNDRPLNQWGTNERPSASQIAPPGLSSQPKMLTEEMILKMSEDRDRMSRGNFVHDPRTFIPYARQPGIQKMEPAGFSTGTTNRPQQFQESRSRDYQAPSMSNDEFPSLMASFVKKSSIPPFNQPQQTQRQSQFPIPPNTTDIQRFMNTGPTSQQQQNPNYSAYQQQMPHRNFQPMLKPPMNGGPLNPSVRNVMTAFQQLPPGMWPNLPPPGTPGYNEMMMSAVANLTAARMQPGAFPPTLPNVMNMFAQQQQMMPNSTRGSTNSLCSSRMGKRTGLPSTKTISDFAFDPYAGLMSKKEREWLIKIQLIQCMVTGDPMDDDYYYSLWKERNVLSKAPAEWIVQMKPKYYNFDNTYPSDRYVPPVFSGSLGRPTHSSTAYPRQILDLHNDSIDDDESTAGKTSQRRLRAILLRIENASLALLECRDFLYKSAKQHENVETNRAQEIVTERYKNIINSVASPDELPTLMLVQKGRFLIGQLILYVDDSQSSGIMETLVKTAAKYSRRIPHDLNNQPLLRAVVTKLRNMDLFVFKHLRETLPVVLLESLLPTSNFAQQLCLSFMIGLCGRDIPISEITSGPIGEWLSDTNVNRLPALFAVFNQDAVDFDLLQLYRGLSCFPSNSIGFQLAELLKARIKQRPS
ncbi:hypothetical protein M3Y98_00594600 [Aphelenchoides besseyi]|nr:hypothetical protein M3Y98_00594600 [Aphelenchoides besseyi]KAI6194009.1 hypothetical protein M3Y96_01079600 [Aphelenchoides besseyi]